jgi:hypothetical protein
LFFETSDLQNLGVGEAIARVERSDFDFNLSVSLPQEPDAVQAAQRRQQIIAASRKKYGTARAEVEAALRQAWVPDQPITKTPRRAPESTPSATSPPQEVQRAEVPKATASEKKDVLPAEPEPANAVGQVAAEPVRKSEESLESRDFGPWWRFAPDTSSTVTGGGAEAWFSRRD